METEPSTSTKQQHRHEQYKQHIDSFFSRHFLETYFHGKK